VECLERLEWVLLMLYTIKPANVERLFSSFFFSKYYNLKCYNVGYLICLEWLREVGCFHFFSLFFLPITYPSGTKRRPKWNQSRPKVTSIFGRPFKLILTIFWDVHYGLGDDFDNFGRPRDPDFERPGDVPVPTGYSTKTL